MKTKFSGILTLLLAFIVQFTFAQEKTISGTVSDNAGIPLPGVNIIIKGTTTGAQTDFDGNYNINASVGDVLTFSYLGLITVEQTVGAANTINVTMQEDVSVLEEVVVTALGIRREKRTLGYGTDIIKGEDLVKARDANIINALQGKVTGVQITNTGGNLGGSSKIIIRGVSSLSGNNNPLWVVDGIIINNNQTQTGSRITGSLDFGNGANVVNPDDIETLTILKGAAATALYGSRAATGVIIVTTKRGTESADGNARVTFNSTVRFDNLFRIPNYQQEYAMGSQGKYDAGSVGFDWGPRIVGQIVENLPITGESGPLTAVRDNGINDFFETGLTLINNFSISDGGEEMDYRLSITSLNQTGILPGSQLDRITVSLNAGFRHSDKLESRFGMTYIKTISAGTGAAGANDVNVIGLGSFSSTLDQNLFKPWKDASGNQINHILTHQGVISQNNPLWIRHENARDRDDDRILANFSITYKPFNGFGITTRVGIDLEDDKRFIENSKGTITRLLGNFDSDNIRRNILTVDVISTYEKDISEDFSLNLLGGLQYNTRLFERQRIRGIDLLIPELFSPGNVAQTIAERDFAETRLIGVYGQAEFGYKNWATLTLTARNDWSSTLPKDNNSYFYPSASLAFVFTDAFNISSDVLSFGKFRASWAQVGNDTNAYQLDFSFFPVTTASGQYSLNNNFPFNGALAYTKSNTIPPDNLLPEEQTSYEFGLDMKLFNGRIGLDLAYFKNENINQILRIGIPETTGFGFKTQNVGQVDQEGFEISIDAYPIKSENFSWNTLINFSLVESTVVSLAEGTERIVIASAFNSVQVVAVPGEEFQLFAFGHLRDSITGRPIINPETGRRIAGDARTFGSVLPDWTAGWINTFTYKNFTISALIDVKWGGVMKSSTVEGLQVGGLVKETLLNREGTFIDIEGVLVDDDGNVTDNNIPLINAQDFWTSLNDNSVAEPWIFDASFVKLREVAITYTLPSKFLKNTGIKGATFGIVGRNLALLYSEVPHIDPEANLFGSGGTGFGIERASVPSTRSVGFNVKLTF